MTRLEAEDLRWVCVPNAKEHRFPRAGEASEATVGQSRALEALDLGIGLEAPGYNIFVTGLAGSGRTSTVEKLLRELASRSVGSERQDRAYVHNFVDEQRPKLLELPPGEGKKLKRLIQEMVTQLVARVAEILEGEGTLKERERLVQELQEEEVARFSELETKLREDGLVPVRLEGQAKLKVMPMVGAEPVSFEVLRRNKEAQLAFTEGIELPEDPDAKRQEIEARIEAVSARAAAYEEELSRIASKEKQVGRTIRKGIRELEERLVEEGVEELFQEVSGELSSPAVAEHLRGIQQHLKEHLHIFTGPDEEDETDQLEELLSHVYGVNLIQEGSSSTHRPIVVEPHPTFTNLFGAIEPRLSPRGSAPGDYTKIRAGSLLRADGGYLIMYAKDVLLEPGVWRTLIRTLRFRQLEIKSPESAVSLTPSALKPDPIPISVKVVLIGDASTYRLLTESEAEFHKIFKVKAEFDTTIGNTSENIVRFAGVVRRIQEKEALNPFDAGATARLVEEAVRLAGRQDKLTTRFGKIADMMRESDYLARKKALATVDSESVDEAIRADRRRHSFASDKLRESLLDEVLLVDTEGERVGQVNGLVYYAYDRHPFGMPARITASVSPGKGGLINIEREVELSGPSHDKGVLILGGYLRTQYGSREPLTLTASVAFEQSYAGVDGDSASLAELLCLLSVLSGLPIRQGVAITGSLNQLGDTQAVGGVNEKIEGFFALCRDRGLTGEQGAILPRANQKDLMLDREVVEACRASRFAVYGIESVDEAIPLLFGVEAEMVHERVAGRLRSLSARSSGEARADGSEAHVLSRYATKEAPTEPPSDPKPPSPGK